MISLVFLAECTLLVLLASILAWFFKVLAFERKYQLPPRPPLWSVITFLPFSTSRWYSLLRRLSKAYDGIYGMHIGNKYVVMVEDWSAVKESFNQRSFTDRPPNSTQLSADQPSLLDMSGSAWKEQRKLAVNSLRLLGAYSPEFADFIKESVNNVIDQMSSTNGSEDVNVFHTGQFVLNNITFKLLYGKTFKKDHPLIRLLNNYDHSVVTIFGTQFFTFFVPYLLTLLERTSKLKEARKVIAKMDAIIRTEIKQHQANLNPNNPKDYIDKYLIEMSKAGCHPSYSEENLIGNIKLLLSASGETINVSLSWFFLCMAANPEMQEKVYQEIQNVVGSDVQPEFGDRHLFPYTMAALQESMRFRNLIDLNIYRQCAKDSKVCGYDIPRGTVVLHNLVAHFQNPKYWKNPDVYDPSRFLSKDESELVTPEFFIPFSFGNRSCPGEKMAKTVLFYFVTSIIQKLKLCPPQGGVNLTVNPNFNNYPAHPYIRFQRRTKD